VSPTLIPPLAVHGSSAICFSWTDGHPQRPAARHTARTTNRCCSIRLSFLLFKEPPLMTELMSLSQPVHGLAFRCLLPQRPLERLLEILFVQRFAQIGYRSHLYGVQVHLDVFAARDENDGELTAQSHQVLH
jgi:hypothetical protein